MTQTKYPLEIDLSVTDDALCDGLPREVLVRFAGVDWQAQFERLQHRIKSLAEEVDETVRFYEERDALVQKADDFLARMKALGIGLPDDPVH